MYKKPLVPAPGRNPALVYEHFDKTLSAFWFSLLLSLIFLSSTMTTSAQFANKVVIVTGAGTGIGADTAVLLAERGARVVIVGRRESPLREVEEKIRSLGGEVHDAVADVSDLHLVEKVVEDTWKKILNRMLAKSL